MSWIKDNKFAAILAGATLLGAIVLFYVGLNYHGRYTDALEKYRGAAEEVDRFEKIPLYPSKENRAGKTKALNEYRTAIGGLQTAFDKFRPKELTNISPQVFTDHAKTANEEVAAAFEKVHTKLPEAFFLGFEAYTASLAREDATGLLDYQLGATKELLLALAKAAPSQLQNLCRPKFPEEDGEKSQGNSNDVARSFPIELTFKGPERSLREFLSGVVKSSNYFYVVRTVRIVNEKSVAPNAKDAKFETTPAAAAAAAKAADPFGGAADFVIPSDEPAAPEPAPTPTPPAIRPPTGGLPGHPPATTTPARPATTVPGRPAVTTPTVPGRPAATPTVPGRPAATPTVPGRPATTAPARPAAAPARPAAVPAAPAVAATPRAAAAPAVDSSSILKRVLGSEELEVFLHIDVLEFVPVKALPEVPKSKP